ncbi:MAG: trypsin-like peptidase domain-containing protein [Thiobacillus sp.]|nr:trypsin-like peptidase domain-containing protein [Thiobacillus sp.]
MRCARQRDIDPTPDTLHDDEPLPDSELHIDAASPDAVPRARSGFKVGLLVAVVAWGAGLFGAWMGVRLADDDRAPARVASTLGLVKVEPRTEPLPALDVFAVASAIGPSVVSVWATTTSGELLGQTGGSGVVLTSDGEIVTNAHVVDGAVTISVRVPGETEPRGAVVLASDPSSDLALLRIDADGLVPATFADPSDIRVGDDVVAVGYALGLDGDPSVTAGIVSALDRTSADEKVALKGLIQTDAPISSGNSGGPLVNALGQVVGITTFVATSDTRTAANSLGFAISNAELLPAVDALRLAAGGELSSDGYLGVAFDDRIDGGSGALVTEVVAGSPADEAGLEVGDAIVGIDGTPITGRAGLVATIRSRSPGDEVTIEVRRGGREVTLRATLAERPVE